MRKQHFASLCNLGLALLFIWLTVSSNPLREWIEFTGYDAMMALPVSPQPSSPIVLIDIDDKALETLGPWPWPRTRLAEGIKKAAAQGARLIGLPTLLNTPQESVTKEALAGLADAFSTTFGTVKDTKFGAFYQTLQDLQRQLDQDQLLATAIAEAGCVALPVGFSASPDQKINSPEAVKAFAERSRRVYGIPHGALFAHQAQIVLPLPEYLHAARLLGHLSIVRDKDHTVRRTQPIYWVQNRPIASFALALAAAYLGVPEQELRLLPDNRLAFNGHRMPLSEAMDILIKFDSNVRPFARYGFADLVTGKVPPQDFSGKVVIFNLSATGLAPRVATPISADMPIGELTAHTLLTLLQGTPISRLAFDSLLSFLLIALAGLVIILLLPRLSGFKAMAVSFFFVLILAGGSLYFLKFKDIWIQTLFPATEVVIAFVMTAIIMGFSQAAPPTRAEQAAEEMRRLQGFSFLAQGQSDDAWDILRLLPVDDAMKSALYELAITFEKQQQPRKALMVYEHIEAHDAEFRDIPTRMSRLEDTCPPVVPETAPSNAEPQTKPDLNAMPAKLGRYELIRPIGFGAMGTVYLGMDPRIRRETAIKTYRFAEAYSPEDTDKMKKKFFREAESAGRLSHPGIVTIFDAGEQGPLAYIAMEFLKGKDLRAFVKKESLLPMRKVIDYVADIADALAYAHSQGVVHRDIKPANIMLLRNGTVKITDFGIARIIATSKTLTGVVKGTPYYMAPEQITGKKVDGRCDIFSLGVVFFQLLTGQLPFTAANPGALMHKIVHDPHPNPQSLNPGIVSPLVTVLNKALAKEITDRYQDAAQMALHLRQIGQKISTIIAKRKATGTQDRS
ncbi:MAG: serine/threonine-protein kinase [Desulfobacterales bacterium]|jgi:serine/threonine-protein kinase|nr:serine/threonine-protein kinase [Desulfobacterales bacterium]